MLSNIFELLTVGADISQFVSLKKTFDNHDQLQLMHRLDAQDDLLYNTLLRNQELILNLLGGLIMNIKEMLDRIVKKDNKYDMDCLGDMFIDMTYALKDAKPMQYKMLKYSLYHMAYGEHLNEELAKQWTENMKNKDDTTGAHWTYEQTEQVRQQYAPECDPYDFYAVLNMMWSDYWCSSKDTMDYVKLTKDFLDDKDGPKDKALKYYLFIVK